MSKASARNTQPARDQEVTSGWLPVSRWIDVGHAKLAYRRVGQGPDLVFVHGWPLHSATWRGLLPHLQSSFTCHLFDLPGTGDSEWSQASEIGLRAHARSVRAAIDQLSLERYALVAHDSGAVIARLVAASDDRAVGLVMSNTEITKQHAWQLKLYMLTAKLPGGIALFRRLLGWRPFRRSSLALGGCFDDLTYLDGEFHELFVRPLLEDPRTLDGQARLLYGLDLDVIDELDRVHASITAPTLMIWGADDPFFALSGARSMVSELAGGAELVELRPGKLFVHEERADDFAAAMHRFLEALVWESARDGEPAKERPAARQARIEPPS